MLGSANREARVPSGRVRTVLPGILVGQINPSGARPVRRRAGSKARIGTRSKSATRRLARRIEAICGDHRFKVAMLAVVVAFALLAGLLASGLGAS
jgi:hypothetical protein